MLHQWLCFCRISSPITGSLSRWNLLILWCLQDQTSMADDSSFSRRQPHCFLRCRFLRWLWGWAGGPYVNFSFPISWSCAESTALTHCWKLQVSSATQDYFLCVWKLITEKDADSFLAKRCTTLWEQSVLRGNVHHRSGSQDYEL